jgi:hypothetical protein
VAALSVKIIASGGVKLSDESVDATVFANEVMMSSQKIKEYVC